MIKDCILQESKNHSGFLTSASISNRDPFVFIAYPSHNQKAVTSQRLLRSDIQNVCKLIVWYPDFSSKSIAIADQKIVLFQFDIAAIATTFSFRNDIRIPFWRLLCLKYACPTSWAKFCLAAILTAIWAKHTYQGPSPL